MKNKINNFFLKYIFLLYSSKYQKHLIDKCALLFILSQRLAKMYNDFDDMYSSHEYEIQSYKHFNRFCLYCKTKNINPSEKLKEYSN